MEIIREIRAIDKNLPVVSGGLNLWKLVNFSKGKVSIW